MLGFESKCKWRARTSVRNCATLRVDPPARSRLPFRFRDPGSRDAKTVCRKGPTKVAARGEETAVSRATAPQPGKGSTQGTQGTMATGCTGEGYSAGVSARAALLNSNSAETRRRFTESCSV